MCFKELWKRRVAFGRDDAVLWDTPIQCKFFSGQSNDRRFGSRHQPDTSANTCPSFWLTWIRLDEASDLTDVEDVRNTRESVAKVENIGVGHLDQLTGLGVRDLEAAEETGGRPVVEASDSNSYPQCAGLAQPAFFPRDTSSSYHVTNGR